MNAISTSHNLYDALQSLEGMTHAELLEHRCVRHVFECAARKFENDDTEDLTQQAFVQFLNEKPISGYDYARFSKYLVSAIKHAVSKAHRWRHQKKRFFQAQHFVYDLETGRMLEPTGERAATLFDHDEVALIRAKLWRRIRDESRRDFVLKILDAFLLEGETLTETAKRMSIPTSRVQNARLTMLRALTATNSEMVGRRRKITDEAIEQALHDGCTKKEAAKRIGLSYNYFLIRLASIKTAAKAC